jgi:colanic acid/amylovoran biosynthesis glycosyltransferase
MEITVIGDAGRNDGEQIEKQRMLEITNRYGLTNKIRFLGYQPYQRVIQEFYNHDVFVSPSVVAADGDTEGGAPVTVIEAAASGMPVMSTVHCDIPFVLSPENGSYLVPERDSSALAGAIVSLLEERHWEPIIRANRRLVEDEMDVRKQAHRLAGLYSELAG